MSHHARYLREPLISLYWNIWTPNGRNFPNSNFTRSYLQYSIGILKHILTKKKKKKKKDTKTQDYTF